MCRSEQQKGRSAGPHWKDSRVPVQQENPRRRRRGRERGAFKVGEPREPMLAAASKSGGDRGGGRGARGTKTCGDPASGVGLACSRLRPPQQLPHGAHAPLPAGGRHRRRQPGYRLGHTILGRRAFGACVALSHGGLRAVFLTGRWAFVP